MTRTITQLPNEEISIKSPAWRQWLLGLANTVGYNTGDQDLNPLSSNLANTNQTLAGHTSLTNLNAHGNATTADINMNGHNIVLDANTGTQLGTASSQKLGFFGANAVVQQADGAALVNNVTAGGTTNQIDDITDLVVYANSANSIRNDIYQLALKLKKVDDALRKYGLLS